MAQEAIAPVDAANRLRELIHTYTTTAKTSGYSPHIVVVLTREAPLLYARCYMDGIKCMVLKAWFDMHGLMCMVL